MRKTGFRKLTARLVAICMILAMLPMTARADGAPWAGGGVPGDPYLIESEADLLALSDPANRAYWGAYFEQTQPIVLTPPATGQSNLAPIGTGDGWDAGTFPFTGTYDGDENTISGLTIVAGSAKNVGLFGYIGESGTLKDITLENVSIIVSPGVQFGSVGGLAGDSHGTVTNCRVTGGSSVTGGGAMYMAVGGLAGRNSATMENCASESAVLGGQSGSVGGLVGLNYEILEGSESSGPVTGGYQSDVGGLVGYNDGTIENCASSADVTAEGGSDLGTSAGGLVGYNNWSEITACGSTGDVTGGYRVQAGGLVGYNSNGTLTDCYSISAVKGGAFAPAGGLVGQNGGAIEGCWSIGDVTGGNGTDAGGLAGNNWGSYHIADCYSIGAVSTGDNAGAGGLVGSNYSPVINSYSVGGVTAGASSSVGGLVGVDNGGSAAGCYYDGDVSGLSDDSMGAPQTTADMMTQGTFVGWDFAADDGVWMIGADEYPHLRWQEPLGDLYWAGVAGGMLFWNQIKGENASPSEVTGSLSLPQLGSFGTTVTWAADPAGFIDTATGGVTKPTAVEGSQTVALTATIALNDAEWVKRFILIVTPESRPLYFKVGDGENRFYYGNPDSGGTLAADLTGWSFGDGTLTLDGFTWSTTAAMALEIGGGDLTISLADGSSNEILSAFDGSGTRDTCGILMELGNLTIEGDTGSLTAQGGGTRRGESAGILADGGALQIAGGHITARSGDWSGGESGTCYGMKALTVTISGGTADAEAGEAKTSCYGIYGEEGVTVNGGTVNAASDEANGGGMLKNGKGISAGISSHTGNVLINGGTVTAISEETTNLSAGISAMGVATDPAGSGNVQITGGTVTATAGTASNAVDLSEYPDGMSGGIFAVRRYVDGDDVSLVGGGVSISGGIVTATAGAAEDEYGVSGGVLSFGEIDISGGEITAAGNTRALYSAMDDVSVTAGAYSYWTNTDAVPSGAFGPVNGAVSPFDNITGTYRYVKIVPPLTYTASCDPASRTFPAATVGYAQQADWQFTITNTGTGPLTGVQASFSNGEAFEISMALTDTSVDPSGTAAFGIRPKTGLSPGTYTDTLAITDENGLSLSVNLSFTVSAEPLPPAYTIAATAGTGGTISPSGAVSVAEGENQTFAIAPSGDYAIVSVTVDGVNQGAIVSYTFYGVTEDHTISASFQYAGGSDSGGSYTGGATTPPPAGSDGNITAAPPTLNQSTGVASTQISSANLNTAFQNAQTDSAGKKTVEITVPPVENARSYETALPASALTSSADTRISVGTAVANVTVPGNMLAGTSLTGNAGLIIGTADTAARENLPDEVRQAIGDRPVIQLTLSVDGRQTDWSNPEAPVTLSIPYTPTPEELLNPEGIVVWYLDGSGNAVSVPDGRYDPATGAVVVDVTHFSDYAVAYHCVSFSDVAKGAWYFKAVSFIAAREITGGTGGGNFSPDMRLTRGQFLVMLMRAYATPPDTSPADNFADAGNTYYTGYLAAAKRLGISGGVGDNLYAPEREITRQEMFTLLYNALKIIGRLPQGDSGKRLDQFADRQETAPWALEVMTLFVKTGTVSGSGGTLNPAGTTTRAEMAQILFNLLGR